MGNALRWVTGAAAIGLTVIGGAIASNCGDNEPPMPSTINGTTNPSVPTPQTGDGGAPDAAPPTGVDLDAGGPGR